MSLPKCNLDLAWGEMYDVGLADYGEFIVNREYASWLIGGGMQRVDGRPGHLQVVVEYENALQLAWRFDDRSSLSPAARAA